MTRVVDLIAIARDALAEGREVEARQLVAEAEATAVAVADVVPIEVELTEEERTARAIERLTNNLTRAFGLEFMLAPDAPDDMLDPLPTSWITAVVRSRMQRLLGDTGLRPWTAEDEERARRERAFSAALFGPAPSLVIAADPLQPPIAMPAPVPGSRQWRSRARRPGRG